MDRRRILEVLERGLAVPSTIGLHLPRSKLSLEDPAVRRIAIHDQHAQILKCARSPAHGRWAARLLKPDREPEGRTLAGYALDPDLAAHELDELLADREPETGAAVSTRRRSVLLREAVEDDRLTASADSNTTVLHLESHLERSG